MCIKKQLSSLFACLLVVALLLTCGACSKSKQPEKQTSDTENAQTSNTENAQTVELENTAPEDFDYLSVDLPQLNKKDQQIFHMEWGYAKDMYSAYIIAEKPHNYESPVYLLVDICGKQLIYDLGKWNYASLYEGNLFTEDIDGDGSDEIVLLMFVSPAGNTLSQVFKIQDNQIKLMADLAEINWGITCEYEKNYMLHLFNKRIGFEHSFDMHEFYSKDNVDKTGRVKGDPNDIITYRQVDDCQLADKNNDGIPDLYCTRRMQVSVYFDAFLAVSFQYNSATKKLEPVYATADDWETVFNLTN